VASTGRKKPRAVYKSVMHANFLEDFIMDDQQIIKVKKAFRESWSTDTCHIFEEDYPYYGQCAQTSIVIQEMFGGEILKTTGWPNDKGNGRHFYNQIDGVRYDFTAEQFSEIPNYTYQVEYEDMASSVEEAETETNSCQISALRQAFNEAFNNA
jgi:hypothetical protein